MIWILRIPMGRILMNWVREVTGSLGLRRSFFLRIEF